MQHLSILQLQQYPVATLISLKAINFITNEVKPIKPIFTIEYEKFIPYLKHINANGFNIYFLPDYQILQQYKFIDFLLDDIKQEQIKQLESDNLHVLYVLETSKSNYQAIMRFTINSKIDKEMYLKINRYLVSKYAADKASIGTAHYFRLAGYTNRKEKHKNEKGLYPFVKIQVAGKINENLNDIIAQLPPDPPKQIIQIGNANGNCERYIATIYERELHNYQDKSQLDYRVACSALKKGFDTESIAQAIRNYSPDLQQRHKYTEDYIQRTIRNARQNFF